MIFGALTMALLFAVVAFNASAREIRQSKRVGVESSFRAKRDSERASSPNTNHVRVPNMIRSFSMSGLQSVPSPKHGSPREVGIASLLSEPILDVTMGNSNGTFSQREFSRPSPRYDGPNESPPRAYPVSASARFVTRVTLPTQEAKALYRKGKAIPDLMADKAFRPLTEFAAELDVALLASLPKLERKVDLLVQHVGPIRVGPEHVVVTPERELRLAGWDPVPAAERDVNQSLDDVRKYLWGVHRD